MQLGIRPGRKELDISSDLVHDPDQFLCDFPEGFVSCAAIRRRRISAAGD